MGDGGRESEARSICITYCVRWNHQNTKRELDYVTLTVIALLYAYLAFQRKAVVLKQNFAAVMGQSKLIDDINIQNQITYTGSRAHQQYCICYFSKVHTPEGDGST